VKEQNAAPTAGEDGLSEGAHMEQRNLDRERTAETPRIYVVSLADHNAGRLHGRWIDADQPAETIREQIDQILAESKEPVAKEWAIHDYEGFGDLELSEGEDIDRVAQAAFLISDHGLVFTSLLGYLGGMAFVERARRYMERGYLGGFESPANYAYRYVEDCYGYVLRRLPNFIRYNLNYESIAHDMELGGKVFTVEFEHKTHVFDARI
jgi:antirestriction protein